MSVRARAQSGLWRGARRFPAGSAGPEFPRNAGAEPASGLARWSMKEATEYWGIKIRAAMEDDTTPATARRATGRGAC